MNEPVVPQGESIASRSVDSQGAAALPQRAPGSQLVRRAGDLVVDTAWRLRRMGPRRGIAALAVLGSILAALFVVWPMYEQAGVLQNQLAQLPVVQGADAAAVGTAKPPELPRVEQLPVIVGALLSRAQEAGLELQAGSYRLVPGKGGSPSRYEIGLPVSGSYPSIRQFVEASLVAVPTLALDGLSLERPDVASAKVEVEVNFVVFVAEGA